MAHVMGLSPLSCKIIIKMYLFENKEVLHKGY